MSKSNRAIRRYIRVPASQIIHKFIIERVGQKRGVPWMASAMMRMKMLDGYEEAALVAARVGAAKMGFYTSPDGQGYQGDDTDSDGKWVMEAGDGAFGRLREGVRVTAFGPQYTHGVVKELVKTGLGGSASGSRVS